MKNVVDEDDEDDAFVRDLLTSFRPPELLEYEYLEREPSFRVGGMGLVYKGRCRAEGKLVAIKVAKRAEFIGRIKKEGYILQRLSHPNIVKFIGIKSCCRTGHPAVVMEFVGQGKTLADFCQQTQDRLTDLMVADIARKLAEAVQHAHDQKVLHRDIKPDNVLITDEMEPKLLDFGVAQDVENATATGALKRLGTPDYMAPEQINPQMGPATAQTDVFLLGATLYQMLTGSPPFSSGSELSSNRIDGRIAKESPADPKSRAPARDSTLCAICMKCLEKKPCRRYQSANDLCSDLERYLSRKRTLVCYKFLLLVRRSKAARLLLAAVLGLAMVGAVVASILSNTIAQVNDNLLQTSIALEQGDHLRARRHLQSIPSMFRNVRWSQMDDDCEVSRVHPPEDLEIKAAGSKGKWVRVGENYLFAICSDGAVVRSLNDGASVHCELPQFLQSVEIVAVGFSCYRELWIATKTDSTCQIYCLTVDSDSALMGTELSKLKLVASIPIRQYFLSVWWGKAQWRLAYLLSRGVGIESNSGNRLELVCRNSESRGGSFSPDGQHFFLRSAGNIIAWDLRTQQSIYPNVSESFENETLGYHMNLDADRLVLFGVPQQVPASGGYFPEYWYGDTRPFAQVCRLDEMRRIGQFRYEMRPRNCTMSDDGSRLAFAGLSISGDYQIQIFDVESGRLLSNMSLTRPQQFPLCMFFLDGGRELAALSENGWIVWRVRKDAASENAKKLHNVQNADFQESHLTREPLYVPY